MMRRLPILLLAMLAISPALAQTAAKAAVMPDLFRRAMIPAAPVSQLYAYDFFEQSQGDRAGTVRGHVDPSRPKGARVTITEANGERVDLKKIDERHENEADGNIWCDQLSNGVDGPISEIGRTEAGRVFAFTPKAKPTAKAEEKNLYKQLAAQVAIDDAAAIRTFHAKLTKPWKPMLLAKLTNVQMTGACLTAPNGRAYAARLSMTFQGSAMGSDFSQAMTRTITNLTPTG